MKNHFSETEQACPCCGEINLAKGFLESLNELRSTFGYPMVINSMCRCIKHNQEIGGASESYHLMSRPWGCCAADVSTAGWTGEKRWAFMNLAMARGFSIGFAKTFIHIDHRHIWHNKYLRPIVFNY